jgi:hypothetical protein
MRRYNDVPELGCCSWRAQFMMVGPTALALRSKGSTRGAIGRTCCSLGECYKTSAIGPGRRPRRALKFVIGRSSFDFPSREEAAAQGVHSCLEVCGRLFGGEAGGAVSSPQIRRQRRLKLSAETGEAFEKADTTGTMRKSLDEHRRSAWAGQVL